MDRQLQFAPAWVRAFVCTNISLCVCLCTRPAATAYSRQRWGGGNEGAQNNYHWIGALNSRRLIWRAGPQQRARATKAMRGTLTACGAWLRRDALVVFSYMLNAATAALRVQVWSNNAFCCAQICMHCNYNLVVMPLWARLLFRIYKRMYVRMFRFNLVWWHVRAFRTKVDAAFCFRIYFSTFMLSKNA